MHIHEHNFGTPWDSSTLTLSRQDNENYTGEIQILLRLLDL